MSNGKVYVVVEKDDDSALINQDEPFTSLAEAKEYAEDRLENYPDDVMEIYECTKILTATIGGVNYVDHRPKPSQEVVEVDESKLRKVTLHEKN